MLIPLKQFICDTCGEIIEKPDDGCLEWINTENGMNIDFHIVHHSGTSNRRQFLREGCYKHRNKSGHMDERLSYFIDLNITTSYLLNFLIIGNKPDPFEGNIVLVDINEYAELVRRLTIPYYEETRKYWHEAKNDGHFDGADELKIYSVNFLKTLVEKYSK